MQDLTITNALLHLRAQIIRGNLDGLAHVEALLIARGIDPARHIVRGKRRPDVARKGIMRMLVLDALRAGPMTLRELTAAVASRRPEIAHEAVYQRTGQALAKLKRLGMVTREGRLWRAASAASKFTHPLPVALTM